MDFTEYRGGWNNLITLVLPFGFMFAACAYCVVDPQIRQPAAWPFVFLLGGASLAGLSYGIASMIVPRLRFTTEGLSFKTLGTQWLRVRWSQIADVSIQNASNRAGVSYQVVVKLTDPEAFLRDQSEPTARSIQKNAAWLTGSVSLNTGLIQISRQDLEREFRSRALPGPSSSESGGGFISTTLIRFADPADPASAHASTQLPAVRYGVSWSRAILLIFFGIAIVPTYLVTSPEFAQRAGGMAWVYIAAGGLGGVACCLAAVLQLATARLELESEGFVYRGSIAKELRVRWQDVSNVRIQTGQSALGTVVMVELRDWDGFLRSCDARQRSQWARSASYFGNGVLIMTRLFAAKPEAIVAEFMRRAGLSSSA